MSDRPADIIPDAEIERIHGYANFGSMSKRGAVNYGVLHYAFGFTTGATLLAILVEHGLVRTPRQMSYRTTLSEKGYRYLRAVFGPHYPSFEAISKATGEPVEMREAS